MDRWDTGLLSPPTEVLSGTERAGLVWFASHVCNVGHVYLVNWDAQIISAYRIIACKKSLIQLRICGRIKLITKYWCKGVMWMINFASKFWIPWYREPAASCPLTRVTHPLLSWEVRPWDFEFHLVRVDIFILYHFGFLNRVYRARWSTRSSRCLVYLGTLPWWEAKPRICHRHCQSFSPECLGMSWWRHFHLKSSHVPVFWWFFLHALETWSFQAFSRVMC